MKFVLYVVRFYVVEYLNVLCTSVITRLVHVDSLTRCIYLNTMLKQSFFHKRRSFLLVGGAADSRSIMLSVIYLPMMRAQV